MFSGVPQGSILGPLLFLNSSMIFLYIHHSMVLLFVDDTKCLKQINSPVDNLHLQCDLNALHAWSKDWKLSFNEPKTILIQFNKQNIYPQFNYTLNDKIITAQDNHLDLGVLMSFDLSWDEHLNTISKRAYQTLGLLQQTISSRSVKARKLLFLTFV